MKAIETHYAGHRFRSRLEARWAVFMDHMGIPWQYETEGFELDARLSLGEKGHRYLPDFWLPEHQLWVEVKGQFSDADLLKTLDCLAALSCNGGGGRHDSGGHDSVVLGPIPRGFAHAPVGLCMNKGDLSAGPWTGQSGCLIGLSYLTDSVTVGTDYGGTLEDVCSTNGVEHARRTLLEGLPANLPPGWREALTAARQARFEFGETPG